MEVLSFRLPGHGDATLLNMNNLRSRQHFCDITIVASDHQTFRGHKVVLAACSPFLRDQFLLNPSSKLQVSVLHSPSVVCELLLSCYTGILQFSPKEIVNYLTAASYLQMEHVVEKCRGALSQYLQPRTPSPSGFLAQTIKLEACVDRRTDTHTYTNSHKDTIPAQDISKLKVKPTAPCEEFQEVDQEDYEVFQVCIEDEEEGMVEKRTGEDDRRGGEVVSLDGRFQKPEVGAEKGHNEGGEHSGPHLARGMDREENRLWRRRPGEQRGVRGRGFRHKSRSAQRERRLLGTHYQDEWRIPTPEEIMGSFGLVHSNFNQVGAESASTSYISSCDLQQPGADSPPHTDYGICKAEVEDRGSADSPARFELDDPGGNQGIEMGVPPAREESESESVAVVGSTSCSTGPISCEPCGLAFPSPESLTLHARSSHPLFVCPRCGKQFNHASNLNRHMSVHRGTKSHRCHLCQKTFTQKSTLCDHMNLHSGERPHRCSYCHVRFAHKPALRRHLKEQHGKTTAQNCLEAQREKEVVGL